MNKQRRLTAKEKEANYCARMLEEMRQLNLRPWAIWPLMTQGQERPSWEPRRAEWNAALEQFREILRRNPRHYDGCL